MKTKALAFAALMIICIFQSAPVKALYGNGDDWKKAKDNAWPGVVSEKTYWYKLDGRAKLWLSADGKNWEADSDGMWTDKEGNFYKIDGRKPMMSLDGGNTWSDVPGWQWQASDLKWYKLDKEWTVWVKR